MGENIFLDEKVHEVSTWQILHHEVEVLGILEGAFEANNPGVIFGDGEYIPLLS